MIGLAGPVAGTMASLVCLQVYKWTNEPLWLAIAGGGFLLNLVNLLPIGMLDGGRISAAITKWMWVIGVGLAFAFAAKVSKQPPSRNGILGGFEVAGYPPLPAAPNPYHFPPLYAP